MTVEETNRFVDSMTWEDSTVMLHGRLFWCLGLCYDAKDGQYSLMVYEDDPKTNEFVKELFRYASDSRDDCMKHFLEDKYWDGKSFYEVAHDMEWIDL